MHENRLVCTRNSFCRISGNYVTELFLGKNYRFEVTFIPLWHWVWFNGILDSISNNYDASVQCEERVG